MRSLASNPRRVLDFLKMTANVCPRACLTAPPTRIRRTASRARHASDDRSCPQAAGTDRDAHQNR